MEQLLLLCGALSSPTLCRFIPALSALPLPLFTPEGVQARWDEGFPLLLRWDFPVDTLAAEDMLARMERHIPKENEELRRAHRVITKGLESAGHREGRDALWKKFLPLELEMDIETEDGWTGAEGTEEAEGIDAASLIFWGRSCIKPSIEWTARELIERHHAPDDWYKGYCPICGSLPAMLFLSGEGERRAHCSWCGTQWGIHRFQCPCCDNRLHESLGYLAIEEEPLYRIQYCGVCRTYFKLIDTRELSDPVCFPLEEWTTLHLDMLAQREGWTQAPSPSPAVYGKEPSQ